MTDCYLVLGVERHASPGEIRAAYLAGMKVCHPDTGGDETAGRAAELSHAYWQLRDAHRRAEHDGILFSPPVTLRRPPTKVRRKLSLAKAPARPTAPRRAAPPVGAKSARRRPRTKRLEPLRAAAGVAACSLAIAGFALAGTYFGAPATPRAHAAAPAAAAAARPQARRRMDSGSAEAAASEFRVVVAQSGLAGAHLYARQCLMELTARPTMTMLDYCMAFDDEASAWESRGRESRRYFAADQRFGRYASATRELSSGRVREAMLADVGYFAQARN